MADYVLVHGGGHGGWCWDRLAPLLRYEGHRVYTPTLTGLGERKHLLTASTDLNTHIADIVGVLDYEDLQDVVLVGHSYGGMVITGVADQARGRIGQLVFLDAAIPRNGEALVDTSPGIRTVAEVGLRTVDGVELVLWPDPRLVAIYGVTEAADRAWLEPKLTPHPWRSFNQKLLLKDEEAVLALPRTNINCTSKLKHLSPEQLGRAMSADRVLEIDTGHDLMVTQPHAVANMLAGLVN